jgi:serine acetyltransferase
VKVIDHLSDLHLYVMKKAILTVIEEFYEIQHSSQRNKALDTFSSMKDEFLPWLIQSQFAFPSLEALVSKLRVLSRNGTDANSLDVTTQPVQTYRENALINDLSCLIYAISERDAEGSQSAPIFVSLCQRANTLPSFMELARLVAKNVMGSQGPVPASCVLAAKSQVGGDCFLGEQCVIGERTSIKRSLVGANCRIGNHVKIANCILLEGSCIEGNVNLANCIIGRHVIVHEKSTLKDCEIGHDVVVEADSNLKGEILVSTSSDSDGSIDF